MPSVTIDGLGTFDVSQDFLSMSPEEQQEEVNRFAEQARSVQGMAQGKDDDGPSIVAGLARSFLGQGMAFGTGDEIEAWFRSKFGDESYDKAIEHVRGQISDFREEHPVLSTGSEILGAMAVPVGGAARAVTTAGRIAHGAATGAASGAAYGFGTGEGGLENRVRGAASGAIIGAPLGAAAPALIEGAIRGGRAAVGALDRAGRPIRSAIDPQAQAGRDVANALRADRQFGDPGLSDRSYRAAQRAGQPVANVDRGGETTRALARSAANQDPAARAKLNELADSRLETQAARIEDQFKNINGREINTVERRARLQEAARRANEPKYKLAMSKGDKPLMSPELAIIASSDAVVDAARLAQKSVGDRAVAEGFGAFNPKLQISEDGLMRITGRGGQPTFPNLRFWDQVKINLDDAASEAASSNRKAKAAVLRQLSRKLRNELDRLVPEYKSARSTAKRFFGQDNALDAGREFIKANRSGIEAGKRAMKVMSKAERELFAEGYIESVLERISRMGDRRSIVGVFQSPQMRQQMLVALGPQRARRIEAQFLLERFMDRLRGAVQGNSTTTRQLAELGLVGGGSLAVTGDLSTTGILTALTRGGQIARNRLNSRVAREVAELLTSGDPSAIQKAAERVAQRDDLFQSLRALERRVAVTQGQRGAELGQPYAAKEGD